MIAEIAKRTLPQRIQRMLIDSVYDHLGLRFRLNSGVEISVGSKTDWLSYNCIFFSGEYDSAILPLRTRADSKAVVLDLGCNTGFFALRCLDVLGRGAFSGNLKWMAVDASETMLGIYRNRVLKTNGLEGRIEIIQGLVGRRSGAAEFYESTNHGANTCVPRQVESGRRYSRSSIDFVDVEALIPDGPIALIKCDIEGSEVDFVRNYGGLLSRTESLIFEFHDDGSAQENIKETLKASGFVHRNVRPFMGTSVEYFTREA
jgi:FkbM family methyltransferase